MTDLDTLLSGGPTREAPSPVRNPEPVPEPAPVPQPRETPPPPPPGERVTDFGRRSADPEPVDPAVPPAAEQEPDHVPVAALKDERKKRQESERIAKEYAEKLAAYERQMQQSPPPAPPARPDLFENPDGALDYVQQQFQQQLVRTKLDMSVAMARSQHEDYGEAEAAFVDAVRANPSLYDQMMADPHPAGFAYRVGKQVAALRDIGGDPEAYRAKVRADLEAELRQQWEAERQSNGSGRPTPSRPSLPPSLAGGRDTNGRFAPAWSGPTPLKDILAPAKQRR